MFPDDNTHTNSAGAKGRLLQHSSAIMRQLMFDSQCGELRHFPPVCRGILCRRLQGDIERGGNKDRIWLFGRSTAIAWRL